MRASVVAVVAAIVVTSASAAASPDTALRVTYWNDSGMPLRTVSWTLRCSPPAGTLPRPARACPRLLAGGAKLFAPLRRNAVCTEIYGGAQRARVVGTVKGRHVRATFTRTNGCEIERWERISPWLVPRG